MIKKKYLTGFVDLVAASEYSACSGCSQIMDSHVWHENKRKKSAMVEMFKLFLILTFVHCQRHPINTGNNRLCFGLSPFFYFSLGNSSSSEMEAPADLWDHIVEQSAGWLYSRSSGYRAITIKHLLSIQTPYRVSHTAFCILYSMAVCIFGWSLQVTING